MLYGKKVLLRPREKSDLEYMYKMTQNDELMYWACGNRPEMEKSLDEFEKDFLNSTQTGKKWFTVEDLKGNIIGHIVYRNLDNVVRSCVVGISLGDTLGLGQGFGYDAMITFLKFLFYRMNLHRVELDTFEDNTRAIKCYEKCGFKIEGCKRKARYVNGEYKDIVIMGILREEFTHILEQYDSTANK
jgi:RimJ/RimL family protein N-acetyltransferase